MISVIIPVYNGEKYIHALVHSFEKQIENDFELIFTNDGSTDHSLETLNDIKNRANLNITIIDQKNAGVSAARNAGIRASKGELLCFCDVDDRVTEDYLFEMRKTIETANVDLVFCKYKQIHLDGTEITSTTAESGELTITDSLTCLKDFLYGRMTTGIWTIMVKKERLINNQLWFAEGYKFGEDIHMLWRLISKSRKIAYLDKRLYIYQLQENSATAKFNGERLQVYTLMKDLEKYFETNAPDFAGEYKKYGVSRLLWSITWQASIYYDSEDFKRFIHDYNIKSEMQKLKYFNNWKVSLSAILFLLSPVLFRVMANKYGKKLIH